MKVLRSIDKNYIELDLWMKAETTKACLLSDGFVEEWVPKSQMEDDPEPTGDGFVKIIIPEWLAQEKEFI